MFRTDFLKGKKILITGGAATFRAMQDWSDKQWHATRGIGK